MYFQRILIKYEFKVINSLIEKDESHISCYIIDRLKKDFPSFFKNILDKKFEEDSEMREIVKDRFKKLREITSWNILVMFWLGIFDLEKYIDYIAVLEEKEGKINSY